MSWTTANMELDDNQTQIRGTNMNELTVRGGNFSYKSSKQSTSTILIAISILSLFFSSPSWKVSCIIQLPLDHLDHALVDHLSPYLSVCPIRHPLWLFVSCGSQGSTVRGSSPHKCGQKSSCSAFNAVVENFFQIFLSSHHPYTFMMHVPIIGSS